MRDVNKLAIASCDRGFPDAKSDAGEGAPGIREHPVKILLVEDNAGDARLLREMLRNDPPESYNLTHFSRMSEAVAHLATRRSPHRLAGSGIAGCAWSG